MKTCKIIVATVFSIFISSLSWADSEAPLFPYVTTAEYGHFYFKMVPDPSYDTNKGSGTCFEVTEGEADKILWQTTGWYSYQVYLSQDAEYLVRMGNWPRGHEVSAGHLAVAFYKKGNLLKSYSTKDLIKNPFAIKPTVSHYFWSSEAPVFKSSENQLIIVTEDKIEYTFDITSGEILTQKKL
ncbi:MAG: hypothetical protein A3C47_03410 [Omnitrophica bacterium RIFCSPHIGHO2_02_FULL_51_18]|nr:MAG: hypothetical protein A3C47_03410 [Omnitrophica bacterium RIFCSPHIGHO2_02_FULL_51_18]